MAEFILKHKVAQRGLDAEFHIESAATSDEESGNHIYPPAQRMLTRMGIEFDERKTSRQLRPSDYGAFDYILCMDRSNYRNILRIVGSDPEGKVSLILDWTARGGEVSDPWYTGDFVTAYNDIEEGCEAFLNSILG